MITLGKPVIIFNTIDMNVENRIIKEELFKTFGIPLNSPLFSAVRKFDFSSCLLWYKLCDSHHTNYESMLKVFYATFNVVANQSTKTRADRQITWITMLKVGDTLTGRYVRKYNPAFDKIFRDKYKEIVLKKLFKEHPNLYNIEGDSYKEFAWHCFKNMKQTQIIERQHLFLEFHNSVDDPVNMFDEVLDYLV